VVFNSAGGFIPKLAGVCLDAVNAFQLPIAINVYLTNVGQKTSAPPHTDKQDVFVLQTQGSKRWRVFTPPPPSKLYRVDPFARGKGKDILDWKELEKPLLDVVLSPGQILYVPGGFPHATGFFIFF
jgi:ribosomal protein L16 Arg81 hydroxylase